MRDRLEDGGVGFLAGEAVGAGCVLKVMERGTEGAGQVTDLNLFNRFDQTPLVPHSLGIWSFVAQDGLKAPSDSADILLQLVLHLPPVVFLALPDLPPQHLLISRFKRSSSSPSGVHWQEMEL